MRISLIVGSLVAAGFITVAIADERATIDASNKKLAEAILKGGSTQEFYAPDAILLPGGAPVVRGNQAIGAFWADVSKIAEAVEIRTGEIAPLGPEALQEIGTFSFRAKDISEDGKYLVIWRKHEGEWKMASDIWNLDK